MTEVVACPHCGQVLEDIAEQIAVLREDLESAERDLRAKRLQLKRLKSDHDEALVSSPHYQDALEVLEFWRETCSPTARELGGERLRNVIERLEGGHTVEGLKLAATGYSRFPYIVRGRRSSTGAGTDWKADAKFIYRDADNVEKGIKMSKAPLTVSPDALKPLRDKVRRQLWSP